MIYRLASLCNVIDARPEKPFVEAPIHYYDYDYDCMYRAMDNGEVSVLVLLDLSKCFDVISHEKLLEKLHLYGIDAPWLRHYLHGHSQQVKIRNTDGSYTFSKSLPITTGVYQGGSLSCLLFAIFANDMCLHVPSEVSIVQFADDTKILVTGKKANLSGLVSIMENALSNLFAWFCTNDMKVNASKSQLIVFGTRQMLKDVPPVSVRFAGTTVNESSTVKNLGVVMDRNLTFRNHVKPCCLQMYGITAGSEPPETCTACPRC